MKFWVDAQLPPQLAVWLQTEFHLDAVSLRDLGLHDALSLLGDGQPIVEVAG